MTLDDLLNYTAVYRETYGSDPKFKPNEHCYWDWERGHWEENDAHFRGRIREITNANKENTNE